MNHYLRKKASGLRLDLGGPTAMGISTISTTLWRVTSAINVLAWGSSQLISKGKFSPIPHAELATELAQRSLHISSHHYPPPDWAPPAAHSNIKKQDLFCLPQHLTSPLTGHSSPGVSIVHSLWLTTGPVPLTCSTCEKPLSFTTAIFPTSPLSCPKPEIKRRMDAGDELSFCFKSSRRWTCGKFLVNLGRILHWRYWYGCNSFMRNPSHGR